MNVLIADKFEESGLRALRTAGCEITYDAALKDDTLRDAIAKTRCSILIVRSTRVTSEMIRASGDLSLIIRAGAGYNTIDVAAASARSVAVANCPGKNAVAVAELTFALILALDRRVVDNTDDLRAGRWNKKEYSKALGLKGRTLGVVGVGQIGAAVIRRALAFEMKVAAYSRSLTPEQAADLEIEYCESPGDVAERSDILSIHLAATPETKGIINAGVLGRLGPGSMVINTSRADVLDYDALKTAVKEHNLRVGLDVYPGEPATGKADFTADIVKAGGIIYGTHHIGASTDQAQSAIAGEAVRIATTYATTGEVHNCVNIQTKSPAKAQMIVRHFNKVGVLSGVLDEISHAGINVEEMSNTMYEGRECAVAAILLDNRPAETVVARIAEKKDKIIKVEVKPIE